VTSPTIRDPWLQRWLKLIDERICGLPILELGCGGGRDSEVLAAAGHAVVGVDRSAQAIANARHRVPSARFHCQELQAPWPVERAGVVVASLSLHYFPWPETEALVDRIHSTLCPPGVLLCRLNSTNDHHFGASGHPALAENFYCVDGEAKRFFDRATIERLFARGWRMLHNEEGVIDRYDHPKLVWELVAERSLSSAAE
jgi:SAM-dependent methyltransferase